MDPATIIVLALSACVIALLAWFEINSRRNEAKLESKSQSNFVHPDFETMKKSQSEGESRTANRKAA